MGLNPWCIENGSYFFADKQAVRFMNGVQSNKYKAVDYDQLKMKAQEMKFKGNKSLIKVC